MSINADFSRIVYPPLNLTGKKVENRALSSVEYINILNWEANPVNQAIAQYRIYQVVDGLNMLIVELDSNTFTYQIRGVEKDLAYHYLLKAVDSADSEGNPASVTIQ